MNWDERLRDARARRAEILRAKDLETANVGEKPSREEAQPTSTRETVEALRQNGPKDALPIVVVEQAPAPETRGRKGLVAMAFGAGIALGAGIFLLPGQFAERPQVAEPSFAPPAEDTAETSAQLVGETSEPGVSETLEPTVVETPEPSVVTPALETASVGTSGASSVSGQFSTIASLEPPAAAPENATVEISLSDAAAVQSLKSGALQDYSAGVLPDRGNTPDRVVAKVTAPDGLQSVAELEASIASGLRVTDVDRPQAVVETASVETSGADRIGDSFVPVKAEPALVPQVAPEKSESVEDSAIADTESALITNIPADVRVWIFASTAASDTDVAVTETALQGINLPVRGVNRVSYRISRNQVRYYDQSSAEAAQRLASAIGATARDFTNANVDPPEGTLEVYLAGEPQVAQTEQPTDIATTPGVRPQSVEIEGLRSSVLAKIRAGLSN